MERLLREGAFRGETHIVTGAGQGIGRCVAATLAAHGACVALVDLDAGRLSEVRGEIAALAEVAPLVCPANVASEDDVRRAVADVLEQSGCINGLVNVAGITRDSRIVKKSLADFAALGAATLVGRIALPEELAASVCAIADPRLFGYTTGQIFAVNGGMYLA